MEKMTNVKAINYVVENFAEELPTDVFEKLNKIKASFENKATAKKPTATQVENEALKAEILEVLTAEGATVTAIQGKSEKLGAISNQRVSALLRQLVEANKVVKTTEKKKSYFALAE